MVDKRERERRVPDPRIAKSLKGEENRGLEKVLALQVIVWLIAQCSSQLSVLCFPFSLDPEIVRDLEKCPNIGKSSYERLERDGKENKRTAMLRWIKEKQRSSNMWSHYHSLDNLFLFSFPMLG